MHKAAINAVSYSPDNRRVVTASDDSTARVWDAITGEPLTPPLVGIEFVSAEFSPEGFGKPGRRRILTISPAQVMVWNVLTRQSVPMKLDHIRATGTASMSPDGDRVSIGMTATATVGLRSGASVPSRIDQVLGPKCGSRPTWEE